MSSENKIIIKDSCILFDLLDLGLIEEFYLMEYTIYTTPYVISEITIENQSIEIAKYIANGRLKIDSDGTIESIQELFVVNPGLSFTDCSVLELALRKEGVLLSADKRLRNEAKRRSLDVKGMLWLIEKLVKSRIIPIDIGIEKLNKYAEINKRIPMKEILTLCINLASYKI